MYVKQGLLHLVRIGYYRLSGYWFAFRERSDPSCLSEEPGRKPRQGREKRIALDTFRHGTTFQNA
ncbi:MAG: Abi family protein, partial [Burkholderiales bacterium]